MPAQEHVKVHIGLPRELVDKIDATCKELHLKRATLVKIAVLMLLRNERNVQKRIQDAVLDAFSAEGKAKAGLKGAR